MEFTNTVVARRVSDQIKEAIKQTILKGEFKAGEKLPPEDQIAASFKVSKVTVREALRDLEGEGIVEKRRGILGGNFVAQPGINEMKDLMTNYYQFGTVTAEELLDFGQIMEPRFVSFAVKRRTDKDLEKMRANIEEREADSKAGAISIRKMLKFHSIIADSCRNPLCSVTWRALMNVSVKLLHGTMTQEEFDAHLAYSKELYACMLSQDENAAQSSMMSIFEKFMEVFKHSKANGANG